MQNMIGVENCDFIRLVGAIMIKESKEAPFSGK